MFADNQMEGIYLDLARSSYSTLPRGRSPLLHCCHGLDDRMTPQALCAIRPSVKDYGLRCAETGKMGDDVVDRMLTWSGRVC